MRKIPVEFYRRVVGFFRPVSEWNSGKLEEFRDRHTYSSESIEKSLTKNIKKENISL